ncbi:MAG: Ribosome association toxin RatA [Candidatus Celerinatantimonas neptuna]|nr:MAG: Ribosome association toxin RatA [Candidatus Celerinatantimonas neptuna]
MPQIQRSALVSFSAEQMYQLVNDVDAYPEFLPGCVGSQVVSADDEQMTATVKVAKAGIRNEFTTCNTLFPHHKIKIDLVNGPFKKLTGTWNFQPLDARACKVILELDFEFSNRLIAMAFGRVFKEIAGAMVQAFSNRAKQVYIS